MNRDLLSNLKGNNGYNNSQNDSDIEMSQIVVDKEFDSKIKSLQKELDKAKDDINNLKQLGTRLKTCVNATRAYEVNKNINNLTLDISNHLRDVGQQLISLSNATKSKPKDKNTNIRISFQKKLANDLKQTLKEFNKVKKENENQAYDMFRHQYKITNTNATEAEIKKSFEENYGSPVLIQELGVVQQSKIAYEESQNRNAEMKRIEQSIEELLNTFQDMQNMLMTQNDAMITIEENIDDAEVAVAQGSNKMEEAIELRKSSRKKQWMITIIIIVVLIAILLPICINLGLFS